MKRSYSLKSGKVEFNFFQIFFFFVWAFGAYATYKYFPVIKTRSELLSILGEASFMAKKQDPYFVKSTIVTTAKRKLDLRINPQDIQIRRLEGYVEVSMKWQTVIDWGFGQKRLVTYNLKKERAIY